MACSATGASGATDTTILSGPAVTHAGARAETSRGSACTVSIGTPVSCATRLASVPSSIALVKASSRSGSRGGSASAASGVSTATFVSSVTRRRDIRACSA